jgi:hypothetical protein
MTTAGHDGGTERSGVGHGAGRRNNDGSKKHFTISFPRLIWVLERRPHESLQTLTTLGYRQVRGMLRQSTNLGRSTAPRHTVPKTISKPPKRQREGQQAHHTDEGRPRGRNTQ